MAEAERFGRYTIAGRLGEGGFATVYRAWDPALNREVALKALLRHLADNHEIYRRFIAEAQALASLHHANIVQVHDVGDEAGRPFFAMELIRGQTLSSALRSGLPDLTQATEIVRRLGSALDALHAAGLVHRDIKPANVMIEQGGRVVLMDLGIARSLLQTQLTQTGASLGTPAYMAPEQVRGLAVTPAADVYALGILAYHLLVGRPPFEGDTAYVLHAHAFEAPPPLRETHPGLPPHVYAAINAALAKDPAHRPASAGAFAAMLAGSTAPPAPAAAEPATWAGGQLEPTLVTRRPVPPTPSESATTVMTPPPVVPPSARRSRPPVVLSSIAVIAVGLALGAGIVLALHNRGGGGGSPLVNLPATPTPGLLAGAGGRATPAVTPSPSVMPAPAPTGSSTSPTAPPTPPPAATFTDFTVRAADQWGAGTGALQGCFSFDKTPQRTLVRLRVTRQQDQQSPVEDVAQTLPAERGNVCIDAKSVGEQAPGNYVAFLFDRDWQPITSTVFNVAPRATQPPTNTVRPTFTATQPPPTRTATALPLPPSPDLSSPASTNLTRPAPKISGVTPLGPARAGAPFEFYVVAKNLGAAGGAGSISVSSPDQRDLTATSGPCDMPVQPHSYPPGTRVTTFSGGAVSAAASSRDPLAELEAASGWPANDGCALDVKVPALTGSTATFYIRVTMLVPGTQQVSSWPLTAAVADQQGLAVIRWDVPVGR